MNKCELQIGKTYKGMKLYWHVYNNLPETHKYGDSLKITKHIHSITGIKESFDEILVEYTKELKERIEKEITILLLQNN